MIQWLVLGLIAVVAALAFILITDGRYFGKGLVRWVYDRFGPAIFGMASEAEHWQALAAAVPLRSAAHVLDVGTATGDLPLTWAQMQGFSGHLAGLDWSPRMIQTAQTKARQRGVDDRLSFVVADARQPLPFATGSCDVVVCFGLLETWPQPETMLADMAGVLTADGALLLSMYKGWRAWQAALSEAWYRQQLATCGHWRFESIPCRRGQDVLIARRLRPNNSA